MPRLFNFSALSTTGNPLIQNDSIGFGPKSNDVFRLTSSFNISSDLAAYVLLKGTILLQQEEGKPELVNVVLKPFEQLDSFFPIKFIIYRGLKKIDFLTTNATNLSDPATLVKTSGSEFINQIQAIQQGRAPGTPVDVKALFGYDLNPADSVILDDFFFKDNSASSQLFTAQGGVHLGNFKGGELIGIDIILENPEFFPTVSIAKKQFYEITSASGSGIDKRFLREQARHFIDPAAFYGLYFSESIGFPGGSTANKQDVYDKILAPYCTKNIVYLDIRNENGYSYNYYRNYIGSGPTPADNEKELKEGINASSLILSEYYTYDWPVHIVSVFSPSTTEQENSFSIALRINDNEKPLIFGRKANIGPVSIEDNKGIFIDEKILIGSDPEWTNSILIKVPNIPATGGGTQLATLVRLDYIKQIRYNETTTDSYPYKERTDFLFGPVNIRMPWDAGGTQWTGSNHLKYVDGSNQGFIVDATTATVLAIDPALKKITISSVVTTGAEITDTIEFISTGVNNGIYTVIKVDNVSAQTIITVREVIPSATIQSGDALKLKIQAYFHIHQTNNRKLIIPQVNVAGLQAFQPARKVLLYGIDNKKYGINFVQAIQFTGVNTIIDLQFDIFGFGFGAVMETGLVAETDTSVTTGDNDRMLFFGVPQYYFNTKGVQKKNFFNFRGGVTNRNTLFDLLRTVAPEFNLEKQTLQISGSPSNTFIATLAYPRNSTVKQNLFLLGLKKSEWQTLNTAAASELSAYHIAMCKLIPQGNRLRDVDYEAYYKYKLVITGMDSSGNYKETTAHVFVYSRDGLIFTSHDYSDSEFVSQQAANNALDLFINNNDLSGIFNISREEVKQLSIAWVVRPGQSNKILLNIDPVVKNLISELRNELDLVSENASAIEDLLKQKGSELLTICRQRIRQNNIQPGGTYSTLNKDGILYLARLAMQVVLKNHIKILNTRSVQYFSDVFEKASRGLAGPAKADFSAYPSNYKRILISGYDPFDAGNDWQGFNSNPSGNIALSLDGEIISTTDGTKTAILRSAIFPVRFKEFNEGWGEDFFTPFILDDTIKMIITFSYGVESGSYFQLDRFASRYRNPYNPDNNASPAGVSSYLTQADKDNFEFIENSLGTGSSLNDYASWISAPEYFFLSQNYDFAITGKDASGIRITQPPSFGFSATRRVDANYASLEPFPDIGLRAEAPEIVSERKLLARGGSGGDYLSNEIFYRVAFLRKTLKPTKHTGHIHVGFLSTNRNGTLPGNRDTMLTIIKNTIKNKILPWL